MCYQWGPKGYCKGKETELLKEEVNVDKWCKFIKDIAFYKPKIGIWGGEPLVYKGITELMSCIKTKGLEVGLVTNGYFLEKYAGDIVANMDLLGVSLDGPEEIHDKLRGKGTFAKVIRGLEKIIAVKTKQKNSNLYIEILFCITEDTYRYMSKFYRYIKQKFNVGFVFEPGWYFSPEVKRKYKQEMKEYLNFEPSYCDGFDNTKPEEIDPEKIKESIDEIEKIKGDSYVHFFTPLKEMKKFLSDPDYACGITKCLAPVKKVGILPNGDVTFCHACPDYIIGNIFEENLIDIWNGKKANIFRKILKEKGLFSICKRCSSLYSITSGKI
jgi:radical SAM protein with 4Fe4S-binding SPASM domain